jgi:hypothetical protein
LEKENTVFNRFYLLFSLVFDGNFHSITIEVIQEIAQTTVKPGNIQILQGRAVILEETNYLAIGFMEFVGCSAAQGLPFSVISSDFV